MSADSLPSSLGIKSRNLGVMFVLLILTIFVIRLIPLPRSESMSVASLFFSFLFLCIGLYAIRGLMRRGKVILHMGYHPISIVMLICSVFLLLGGFLELVEADSASKLESALRAISMGFGFGACHIAALSVCESGIWFMGSLLRWDEIKRVAWDESNGNQMRFEKTSNRFPWRFGIITVPAKHHAEFEALVNERVAVTGDDDMPH